MLDRLGGAAAIAVNDSTSSQPTDNTKPGLVTLSMPVYLRNLESVTLDVHLCLQSQASGLIKQD
jgi:hypothetical protein